MKNDLVVLRRRKQKLQEKEKENNSKMSAALNQHIFSEIVLDFVHNKFDDSQEQKIGSPSPKVDRSALKVSTIENQSPSEESSSATTKNIHKCTTCVKDFKSPSKLLRHMNSSVHEGLKPYECEVCR